MDVQKNKIDKLIEDLKIAIQEEKPKYEIEKIRNELDKLLEGYLKLE